MITIESDIIEKEVSAVIKEICTELEIDAVIDGKFRPGDFIKSQVLLDTISTIEEALKIIIPNEVYIFSEKDRKQLSIEETVQKIINVAKNAN